MDFYVHFVCRAYRHSPIIECPATKRAACLAVVTLMEKDPFIEPTTAWWDAVEVVEMAAEAISARRARKAARYAQRSAANGRIDTKGRIAAYFDQQPRSRRATFA